MNVADTAGKSVNVKWIIALCLTATLAIVGWTIMGTQSIRLKSFEEIKEQVTINQADTRANNVRLAVLENKYDTIQAALAEIKVLLQKYMEK